MTRLTGASKNTIIKLMIDAGKGVRCLSRLILLSAEDYRRLAARGDSRKSSKIGMMPDELLLNLEAAV